MIAIYKPTFASGSYVAATFCIFASGLVRRATNPDLEYAKDNGVPVYDMTSSEQYNDMLRISGSGWPPCPA